MKLKRYLGLLNRLVDEDPSALDLEVVAAIDDEGNGFKPVRYAPSTGRLEGTMFDSSKEANKKPNAVCVN